MPDILYQCSGCPAKLSKRLFRDFSRDEGERGICRFCEQDEKIAEQEERIAENPGARLDDNGMLRKEIGDLTAKVFILERQLGTLVSESDRRTEQVVDEVRKELASLQLYRRDSDRRNQRFHERIREELNKVQEDLVTRRVALDFESQCPNTRLDHNKQVPHTSSTLMRRVAFTPKQPIK